MNLQEFSIFDNVIFEVSSDTSIYTPCVVICNFSTVRSDNELILSIPVHDPTMQVQ